MAGYGNGGFLGREKNTFLMVVLLAMVGQGGSFDFIVDEGLEL